MIEVHLYGKLRRFSEDRDAKADSILKLSHQDCDTVRSVVLRIGVPIDELGSNLFLNGRYGTLETTVADGDRLGLFPDDMQLLYKWSFAPSSSSAAPNLSTEDPASGSRRSESGTAEEEK
jgi:molybdopterin converting factor small subunit